LFYFPDVVGDGSACRMGEEVGGGGFEKEPGEMCGEEALALGGEMAFADFSERLGEFVGGKRLDLIDQGGGGDGSFL